MSPRKVQRISSNTNVTVNDQGTLFIATAAAVFTLPTAAHGLSFRFVQTADADMSISGTGLVHNGSATATSVAFSTTSHKIGSHALVECVYTGTSTLKWIVTNLGGTTATVS